MQKNGPTEMIHSLSSSDSMEHFQESQFVCFLVSVYLYISVSLSVYPSTALHVKVDQRKLYMYNISACSLLADSLITSLS